MEEARVDRGGDAGVSRMLGKELAGQKRERLNTSTRSDAKWVSGEEREKGSRAKEVSCYIST